MPKARSMLKLIFCILILTSTSTYLSSVAYATNVGNTTPGTSGWGANAVVWDKFAISATCQKLTEIDVYSLSSGNVKVSVYDESGGYPNNRLFTEMSQTVSAGQWNKFTLSSPINLNQGNYYFGSNTDTGNSRTYTSGGAEFYKNAIFSGAFPNPAGSGFSTVAATMSIYAVIQSCGPPPSDFTITANPTSQTVGAGGTASSTLSLTAGGAFSSTVTLSVTNNCPNGVTCTVSPSSVSSYPASATLTVPTLLTTSGVFSVIVTATNGTLIHTVTFTVTVTTPPTYNFNVRSGATQVVVTVSWTGTATSFVTIAGPSGNPTITEAAAVVYDRTMFVSGGTQTNIHRVTFALTSPPTGTWTAFVSPSGATVTIEVS